MKKTIEHRFKLFFRGSRFKIKLDIILTKGQISRNRNTAEKGFCDVKIDAFIIEHDFGTKRAGGITPPGYRWCIEPDNPPERRFFKGFLLRASFLAVSPDLSDFV